MFSELIRAFLLILIAEMGDKTQIIAMTFATKYRMKEVLLGVFLGVLFNHGIAIALGRAFSKLIPLSYIQIFAGIIFVVFAYLSLREEDDEEDQEKREFSPIITVALAFFIGELGDKTQLTAMTLAMDGSYPIFILMGTTLGMLATSGLGIIIGGKLGKKIPDLTVNIVSSLVFFSFGALKLMEVLASQYYPLIFLLLVVEVFLVYRMVKRRRESGLSALQKAAQDLYEQTSLINSLLDDICLGEETCGNCQGRDCFLGYIRSILKEARSKNDYTRDLKKEIDSLNKKSFDQEKILKALLMIKKDSEDYSWPKDPDFVINGIASYLENYLFAYSLNRQLGFKEYLEELKRESEKLGFDLDRLYK